MKSAAMSLFASAAELPDREDPLDGPSPDEVAPIMSEVAREDEYSRFQAAQEAAKKKGLVVVEPKPDQLFIDIDDECSDAVFDRTIGKVQELIPGTTWSRAPSPSGALGRFHIVVTLGRPVADAFERILLQALMGSDRIREVLSWQRATRGDARPTLFFEKPDLAQKESA
jgi:hypothetical protein